MYEHDNTFHWQQAKDVANAWREFFGPAGLGPLPDEIRYFCCAQFVVRKRHIQRHPREFYLQVSLLVDIHSCWLSNLSFPILMIHKLSGVRACKTACQAKLTYKKSKCRHRKSLQAIHWLDTSPWRGAINPRYSRGLVFETLWHVIMGEQPVMEDPHKKECEVYNCSPIGAANNRAIARERRGHSNRRD